MDLKANLYRIAFKVLCNNLQICDPPSSGTHPLCSAPVAFWGVIHKKKNGLKNFLKNVLKNVLKFSTLRKGKNWSSWDMSQNQNYISKHFSKHFFSCESRPCKSGGSCYLIKTC